MSHWLPGKFRNVEAGRFHHLKFRIRTDFIQRNNLQSSTIYHKVKYYDAWEYDIENIASENVISREFLFNSDHNLEHSVCQDDSTWNDKSRFQGWVTISSQLKSYRNITRSHQNNYKRRVKTQKVDIPSLTIIYLFWGAETEFRSKKTFWVSIQISSPFALQSPLQV